MYNIYKYTSPSNKNYIGQTIYSLEQRRGSHCCNYIDSPLFYNALQKYGIENFKIEILKQCKTKKEANYWENYFILLFRSYIKEYGYNLTLGGDGNTKYNHEAIVKDYLSGMSKTNILNKYGCSSATYGRILKENGIDGKERIKRSAGQYNVMAVLQYDLQNNLIAEFKSLSEAERKTGVYSQNIGRVCKGIRKTAGGFIWKYKNQTYNV